MKFIYHKVCRHFIIGIHYARVTTSEVSNSPRTGVPSWWIHQWPWLGVCCILRVVAGPGKIIELEALRGHSFTVNVLLLFLLVLVSYLVRLASLTLFFNYHYSIRRSQPLPSTKPILFLYSFHNTYCHNE